MSGYSCSIIHECFVVDLSTFYIISLVLFSGSSISGFLNQIMQSISYYEVTTNMILRCPYPILV